MIHGLFTLLLVLACASQSWATNYFVAKTGSDAAAGGVSTPWLTIQKAANTMVAGDTVTVNAGTYAERVGVTTSGTAGNFIRYQTNGVVVMQGFRVQASYTQVVGFEITNSNSLYYTGIGVYVAGTHNEVTSNYVHDLYWEGIWLFGENARDDPLTANNLVNLNTIVRARTAGIFVEGINNTVDSNDISHTITDPPGSPADPNADADGMRFFGSGHIFRKNNIHDILDTDAYQLNSPHIDCFQTWGPATNMLFEQNVCHGAIDNMQATQASVLTAPVGTFTYRNNIFYDMTHGINISFLTGQTIDNLLIVNNTFKNITGQGVILKSSSNDIIRNNLFYNVGAAAGDEYLAIDVASTGATISNNGNWSTTGSLVGSPYTNDVWADPKIVSGTGNDFHLQSTSPLRDAGVTLGTVTNDKDGTARPIGTAYDIGAYEYHGGFGGSSIQ